REPSWRCRPRPSAIASLPFPRENYLGFAPGSIRGQRGRKTSFWVRRQTSSGDKESVGLSWCLPTNSSNATVRLKSLRIVRAKVSDLSPLKGLPPKQLWLDYQPQRDAALLRSRTGLEQINDKPAAEFWKEQER